jgi:hypothetical protein
LKPLTTQTSRSVVAEITGEPIVENPIKPNVIPNNWLGYWFAHPVYKNWFTAGQIRRGHLKEIQDAGFKSVINMFNTAYVDVKHQSINNQ